MKHLVSLLIPVYNSEKYIGEALESVEKQDYDNLEIIILDDGSTDSSFSIISHYKERDERIKVERRENGGIGSARNRLLSLSQGEFVFFLDSDDILSSSNLISRLVEDLEKYGADVAAARTLSFRKRPRVKSDDTIKIYSGSDFASLMARPCGVFCYPHSRLIRKSLFSSFSFPTDMIFEDIPVMPWVIRKSERVVYDRSVICSYRINKKGLSHGKFSPSSLFEMDAYYTNIKKAMELKERKITLYSSVFFLSKYYYYLFKVLVRGLNIKEYQAKYKRKAKEAWNALFYGG
ncbi:MAG: glycosyltransferase family 2 protein [Candidatus Ornithospirochaeta sp.]